MTTVSAIADLEAKIRAANAAYWVRNAPEISDQEYDALVRRLRELAPDSPLLNDLGSVAPATRAGAVTHKTPMLSLDKCYAEDELLAWSAGIDGDVVAMAKFDGIACSLVYDAAGRLAVAATRGDGSVGDDITINAGAIADIPRQLPRKEALEVRGEIYMKLSVFEQFRAEGMANPRNLAAGAIKQKDREKSAAYRLSFAAYDLPGSPRTTQQEDLAYLAELGFPPVEHVVLPPDRAGAGFAHFSELRGTLDYEIDGVVYRANRHSEQKRLGNTAHHPRFAIAYKFQGDAGSTTLREVEWSVARTGAITPVAIVVPVALSGVSVSRASLHNVAYIDRLGLTLGATVTIVRRGGVIPHVEAVTAGGDAPVPIPTACPSCGGPVVRERDFLYCMYPAQCKRAVLGKLAHFATALDILGFGESLLEQAYDAKILRTPADFFRLTVAGLAALAKVDKSGDIRVLKDGSSARLGETVARKVLLEVDKKRNVPLATFLRALGIAELGKTVSKILADKYLDLDAVLGATVSELAAMHGIGEAIATRVVTGLQEAKDEIADLRNYVQCAREERGPMDGPLRGLSFVFTGKMVAFARSEGEKRVREAGGEVLSSVTAALSYLVVGDDKSGPKSAKEKAAEKLLAQGARVAVIGEPAFLALLEGRLKAES